MRGYANIYRIISMSSVVIGNVMDNRYGNGHIFIYINFFFGKEGNLGFSSIFPGPVTEYY